ncbi:MAG TPA: FHA domain-containing protein, partial [Anaerolineales bacterium]|nr:FHA domain-containing protein [Anaerolineales bacterium]
EIAIEKSKKRKTKPKKTEAGSKSSKEAFASFVKINPDGQFAPVPPLPVNDSEIIFGTDPVQCTLILDDASISSIHARLRITDDGGYLLLDNNSVGGTWVNYDAIPHEGYRLRHGDMVNFGQLTYRFMLKTPPIPSSPKITVQPIDE